MTMPRPEPWRALGLFNLYRILIAGVFLTLFTSGAGPAVLGRLHPQLFLGVILTYLTLGVMWGIAGHRRWPSFRLQVYLQGGLDIAAIALLTHASGGVTSGFGMLLVASVGGIGLLIPGRTAVFFAALASITLLLMEAYGQLSEIYATPAYTQTGILGALLFATALLAHTLARRARESEDLATRRGIDLANLAELNEHIIERMQSGVVVVDDEGDIRLMNEAAWGLLGNPLVRNPFKLAEVCPGLWTLVQSWRQTQRPTPQTLPAGDALPTELQVRLTRLGSRGNLATLAFLEDTAEIRNKLQEVKLASLGRLTASIAHEIRNPLGAISHAAQLMAESPELGPEDQRLLEIIQTHSRRMNGVVRNVLQLSRRESPNAERIALSPWLEELAGSFLHHERLPSGALTVHVDPPETAILFDPGQLHQVLWNLCSNAAKYGTLEGGTPALEIRAGTAEGGRRAYIEVVDHGPGIPPAERDQLFEPFFTTSPSGTGLGLYIARQLCENNGGRLDYVPIPTGGSCFRIELPEPSRASDAA